MLTERIILNQLEAGEIALPPLSVGLLALENGSGAGRRGTYHADARVQVRYKSRRWRFLVEFKAVASPRSLDNAIRSIVPAAKSARILPMVILPYLSEEDLMQLEKLQISGIDLCGNGIVIVPNELLVRRSGQPNRYRRSDPIRNVYRGSSSLVGRLLLQQAEFSAVGELVAAIKSGGADISFATVSKVLKSLEEDLIVGRSPGSIRLLQADKLLDLLAENYRPPSMVRQWLGTVDLDAPGLSRRIQEAAQALGTRVQWTGQASASEYAVLAQEPIISIYSPMDPIKLLQALGVRTEQTNRFPNFHLLQTTDSWVYFQTAWQGGLAYASPVQCYLELMAGDPRSQQAAAQVRRRIVESSSESDLAK